MQQDLSESRGVLDAISFGIGNDSQDHLLLKWLHCQCTPQGGDIDRWTDKKGKCGTVMKDLEIDGVTQSFLHLKSNEAEGK